MNISSRNAIIIIIISDVNVSLFNINKSRTLKDKIYCEVLYNEIVVQPQMAVIYFSSQADQEKAKTWMKYWLYLCCMSPGNTTKMSKEELFGAIDIYKIQLQSYDTHDDIIRKWYVIKILTSIAKWIS